MTTYRRIVPALAVLAGLQGGVAMAGPEAVTPYPAAFFASSQPYSAWDMVARLPGFTFDGGDSDVRGFSGAGGNVLIDGKPPTSKAESLESILRRIPARSVVRIELVRPGAAGLDLQGRALTANVVRGRETTTRGRLETGIEAHRRTTAPRLSAEFSRRSGDRLTEVSASIGREVEDDKGQGPRLRVSPAGALLRDATYSEDQAHRVAEVTAGHERDLAGGRLRLDASIKADRTRADILEVARFPAPTTKVVVERERVLERETGGHYDHALSGRWALETLALLRATRTRAGDRSVEGAEVSATRLASDGRESIARALLRRQGAATTLEIGGEAALNSLDSHSGLSENGAELALPAANVRVEERRAEGFATLTWRASDRLTIETAARLETATLIQSGDSALKRTFLYPKPRLLVVWAPDPRDQWRLSLERRVGQLDFADFVSSTSLTSNTVTAGNPDLEPDKAWRLTAAWERRLPRDGALVLTVRHDAISDAVDRVPVVGPGYAFDAPGNIGEGRRTELELDATLPLDALRVRGGLLKATVIARRSRVTDPATGLARSISDAPPLEGAVHFTQDLPARHLRWGIDATLAEDKPEYRFDEVRHDRTAARLAVFAEWRPAPAWSLRLHADNLTDGEVVRRREQYAGPRGTSDLKRIETRVMTHGAFAGLTLRRSFDRL
jgi:outer membrane receptor protein involved in Fe transport